MKFFCPTLPPGVSRSNFSEFKEASEAYFAEVDSDEILRSITYEDVRDSIWRPFGFRVLRASSVKERRDGSVRVHLWPEVKEADLPKLVEHEHRHGAHLGSLVMRGEYEEQEVEVCSNPSGDLEVSERSGSRWISLGLANIEVHEPKVYSLRERHYVSAHSFHKTVTKPRGFTATLVVLGPVLTPEATIHPIGNQQATIFSPDLPPESEAVDLWNQLQESVGSEQFQVL